MWFLWIVAAALGLGLSRRLSSLEVAMGALGAVFLFVLYAALKTHAL